MAGQGAVTEETLPALRREIDAVDARLVGLLAERFRIVERVVAVKKRDRLPANIPERVEEVVDAARRLAEAEGLPSDLAETLWRAMVAWTIEHEEKQLSQAGGTAS